MSPVDRGGDPNDDLAGLTIADLDQCSDSQLQAVIDRAQRLLHDRHDPTAALEARPDEEILQIHDHDGYTIVITERTDGSDSGPYLYRVNFEPAVDGDEGEFRWHYLGKVDE